MEDNKEKLKNLRKLVKESFSRRMSKCGLDRHSGGTFYRKTDFGRVGITLFYHHYGDGLKIEASASIKVDEAERILFEYRTTARATPFPPPKQPNDFTVCENLGNIKIGIWRQWFIYQESDVGPTLDEVESMVANVGIPFLEKFREPELLLQEMVDSTRRKSVLGRPVFRFNQLFALTLALKRRDIFNEMRPVFEAMLRDHKQFSFSRVKSYLDWIEAKFDEPTFEPRENNQTLTS
jgi:hypothetical protein